MARALPAVRLLLSVTLLLQSLVVGPIASPVAAQSERFGITISGTAVCPPSTQPLARAVVTVFSGAALVATTDADANGRWSLPGAAPDAIYTVRYSAQTGDGPAVECGLRLTTNSEGFVTTGPSPCPNPDNSNRVWNDALPILASTSGAVITDSICHANESRWYRVPILPGQRVTAQIDDPSFNLTLGLYKDIQQVSDSMTAAANQPGGLTLNDLQRFTASIPRDASAPDATAPDATAPDATAPDATAPDATAPDATAPDATAPDATAPDATAPDATAPDATAPDATAGTYSAALSSSLIAFSDKPGRSPELVRRHTWDNAGFFYIRVRGHNGAFDETQPFHLTVTVVNHNCTTGTNGAPLELSTTPFSKVGLPAVLPRTLILTNTAGGRFASGSDTTSMLRALRQFAARPEVNGFVLDLAGNAGLAADYAQWDAAPQCAPAANIVANQIQKIVSLFHSRNLQYVVIAGGDRVIPFARIVDQAGMSNEEDYSPAVLDSSESQASLKTGYFLSQDLYGSFSKISNGDHDFNTFDLPVGRLVESPPEIITMLAAYVQTNGVVRPTSGLVTGYDFLADSSTAEADDLAASGLSVDRSLIQPEGDGPKAATAWSADDLRAQLFGSTHFGVLDLNAHFSGNTLLAADDASRMRSGEVATVNDQRFFNSLVLSMGCHSGYNIVDPDATPGTPRADWAQAFATQGATLVGGTGYQYGNSPFIKYSEVLLDSVTHELRLFDGATPGPVSIGQAVLNAKRAYVHAGMTGIDEKAVAELTLYGLPMMGVSLPAGRIPRPAAAAPATTAPGKNANLSSADNLAPSFTLSRHDRKLSNGDGFSTATFFDASYAGVTGDVQTTPGQPVLPQVVTNVAASNAVARGVVLLSAAYTDIPNFRPLVDAPSTEVRSVRPAFGSSVFTPAQIVNLAEFQGQFLVERPFQFRSSVDSLGNTTTTGTGRQYGNLSTRVYYSNRADASALGGPPIIYSTTLTNPAPNVVSVDVAVGGLDAEGIEDVFATFTSEPTDAGNNLYGKWTSVPLRLSSSFTNGIGLINHYTASIDTSGTGANPQSMRLFVQAVSGTGLVSLATNNGAYYQFVPETATLGNPKAATSLTLQPPATPYVATYRSRLTVSALLSDAVTGAPIGNRSLTFTLGRASARALTDATTGVATATLPVLVAPDAPPPRVTVGFAEDPNFLGSGDARDVTIARAPTMLVASLTSVRYADAAVVATLFAGLPSGNLALREVGVRVTLPDGRVLDTLTDGYGQVLFDTADFQGVQPGTYATTITFAGNDRYLPSSLSLTQTVTPGPDHSLALNGVSGFAEAPGTPDLNMTGDWTVEVWFKDEDPNGFKHRDREIVNKGNSVTPEVPYFVRLGGNMIRAGLRTGGRELAVAFNLAGLDPGAWHHVAASFRRTSLRLDLYLDDALVKSRSVPRGSLGNDVPLEIGRSGPSSGVCLPPRSDADGCDDSDQSDRSEHSDRPDTGHLPPSTSAEPSLNQSAEPSLTASAEPSLNKSAEPESPQAGAHWLGKLDDLRIWKIARSAPDIRASFKSELPTAPPGLVANWKFDERPGTLAAFSSPNPDTAILSTRGASFSADGHP